MVKIYCETCSKPFTAQRSSAKYCCESCKQKAKYARSNDYDVKEIKQTMTAIENSLHEAYRTYFDDNRNPDDLIAVVDHLQWMTDVINKMSAKIAVIELERQSTWYQCKSCGQKSFGLPDKCDFCNESDFDRIKLV